MRIKPTTLEGVYQLYKEEYGRQLALAKRRLPNPISYNQPIIDIPVRKSADLSPTAEDNEYTVFRFKRIGNAAVAFGWELIEPTLAPSPF